MKALRNILNRKKVQVPVHGDGDANLPFLLSIGGLVVAWANNESVFLAMLQLLITGDKQSAAIVWHSHKTSLPRLELISRLCRERVNDEGLLEDLQRAISHFKGFTRVRNFYCHATYTYDSELRVSSESSATATQEGAPLMFVAKNMDASVLNEIGDTTKRLGEFNRHLWSLVPRLGAELGVQHAALPKLPP